MQMGVGTGLTLGFGIELGDGTRQTVTQIGGETTTVGAGEQVLGHTVAVGDGVTIGQVGQDTIPSLGLAWYGQ